MTRRHHPRPKILLELFSGTGSVRKEAERKGYKVISVDIDPKASPTICTDILKFNYKKFPRGYFDIIWASPPCNTFSNMLRLNLGRVIKRHPGQVYTRELMEKDELEIGVVILRKTLEIIHYFNPRQYFIENPQTGRMKNYMADYHHTDVCYCMYGFDYKKPTRIWHNTHFTGRMCNHTGKHKRSIGRRKSLVKKLRTRRVTSSVETQKERYSIPPSLVTSLMQCADCKE
jgi:hypothetical protein